MKSAGLDGCADFFAFVVDHPVDEALVLIHGAVDAAAVCADAVEGQDGVEVVEGGVDESVEDIAEDIVDVLFGRSFSVLGRMSYCGL